MSWVIRKSHDQPGQEYRLGEYRSVPKLSTADWQCSLYTSRIELNARQADNNERTYLCILSVEKDIILNLEVNWDDAPANVVDTEHDTDFYLKKGFRVISIEAIPTLCAVTAERFKDYVDCGKLVICNMGVSHSRGELSFFINHNHNEWSSFDRDIASRGHPVPEIKVSTATTEDFSSTFGIPYYCKIDIEGLDYVVVNTIANLKEKPRYVSFENGHLGDFEALASAGYDSFQLVEQSAVPQMQLPSPSLEGATITYQFSAGASGPFGNDLPGRWCSIVETRAILEKHHNDLAARKTRGYDWWDLHARHGVKNEYHSF